ncbi:MAG: DMT family transporter [Treponema sp.]|jgi:drug/metabolite transporter (DMT)-like permease|nr:DMT family transporter [Treponema sp.]
MDKQALRADLWLLLTACIWGFAFTAQRSGMAYMGPFSFNAFRFFLGSLTLAPLAIVRLRRPEHRLDGTSGKPLSLKTYAAASTLAGLCLFAAASFQQTGIIYTSAGNSGFITGLYLVFTPIAGIFLGKKTGASTWTGAALSFTGLFFLSAAPQLFDAGSGPIRLNPGDLLTLVSALFWTAHILVIDTLVRRVDPVLLSAGQFLVCGLASLIIALGRETISPAALGGGLIPLLYSGLCSVGIAYTLQVAAQKYAPPAHAVILLSLEGVFAALGGVIILHEPLGRWTLAGFALMFCGMLASQWRRIRESRMALDRGTAP